MVKHLIILIFIHLLSLTIPTPMLAQSEFSTSYNVDYHVQPSGITHTKFEINLANNLSNIYASEFALSIGSTKLENIKVSVQKKDTNPKIATGDKTTNVTIPLEEKVLGKDKSQDFVLEFDSLDFASQLGSVWEISIPKLQKSDNLKSYTLTLSIPSSFGNPSTISPKPISKTPTGNQVVYRFSQQDLLNSGISAVFGTTQYYDFSLTYHLENTNVYPIKTEVALPPDTAYQKVIYQTIDPKPENVNLDEDGNWLATYSLSPKQTILISATGSAQIHLNPIQNHSTIAIDPNIDYLSSQKYWEVDNPNIISLAEELKTPQKIYQYIVDNLIYDYGRLSETTTRFGAANAIDNKDSAICMEFTDLFVAIARAAGIKARAVNGFAYTTNSALRPLSLKQDILHAWPEYYSESKQLWIPIDPTWGNTTGGVDFFNQTDLNHFTFTLLGKDSSYPVPAGAYKIDPNQEVKDVYVSFGNSSKPNYQTKLDLNFPKVALAGIDIDGTIVITNTGNSALYNQTVYLYSQNFTLETSSWTVPVLPPFSSHTISVKLPATDWNKGFTENLQASSDLSTQKITITLSPAHNYILNSIKLRYILLTVLGTTLSLFAFKKLLKKNDKIKL